VKDQKQVLDSEGPEAGSRQCRSRHFTVQDQKQTLDSAGPEADTRQCRTSSKDCRAGPGVDGA
jgi:hypothetical protein